MRCSNSHVTNNTDKNNGLTGKEKRTASVRINIVRTFSKHCYQRLNIML
jgi:hypothetical protein